LNHSKSILLLKEKTNIAFSWKKTSNE